MPARASLASPREACLRPGARLLLNRRLRALPGKRGEPNSSHRQGGYAMHRTKPPFRADHVGSLLRPAALKDAREKFARGEIAAAALKAVEDREIERVIRKQEE